MKIQKRFMFCSFCYQCCLFFSCIEMNVVPDILATDSDLDSDCDEMGKQWITYDVD